MLFTSRQSEISWMLYETVVIQAPLHFLFQPSHLIPSRGRLGTRLGYNAEYFLRKITMGRGGGLPYDRLGLT